MKRLDRSLAMFAMLALPGCAPSDAESGVAAEDGDEGASSSTEGTATTTGASTASATITSGDGDGDGDNGSDDGPGPAPPLPEAAECPDPVPGVDAPGAPSICSIRFENEATLLVQMTEPVVLPGGVDPERFRISAARSYPEYGGYGPYTEYMDPLEELCSHTDACFGESTVIAVSDDGDPSVLRIHLDQFSYYECGIIESQGQYLATALLLHYRNEAAIPITDLGGLALASVAEHFVDEPSIFARRPGFYAESVPFVPIDCPTP